MNHLFILLKDTFYRRNILLELAKQDFKSKYLGTYLGIFWAFIQPTLQILIFWYVFQVGFKSMPVDKFPYILWLITGMIPWFFISEALLGATNSIKEHVYLVKNIQFRISTLPLVKIISVLYIHIFFVLFIIVMFLLYGFNPTLYLFQIIYYLVSCILLLLGIAWFSASLVIFLKDVGQVIGILLQFGFWLTPIMYSFKTIPQKYHSILKLNPFYYIVQGYRDTFIYHYWFWQHPYLTINFWLICLFTLLCGMLTFKRLRPHFADVI